MSENLNASRSSCSCISWRRSRKADGDRCARYLNKPKSSLTHILDSLDGLALMERVEGRKSVLTAAGKRTAQELLHQRKILEQYMQYQDIPPAQIKENALRALSAGFSDEFMARLAEQEAECASRRFLPGTATSRRGYLQLPQGRQLLLPVYHLPGTDQEPQQPLHGKPWL